jgi:hypothetical protein
MSHVCSVSSQYIMATRNTNITTHSEGSEIIGNTIEKCEEEIVPMQFLLPV